MGEVRKRRVHSVEFKAKVGIGAVHGVKTRLLSKGLHNPELCIITVNAAKDAVTVVAELSAQIAVGELGEKGGAHESTARWL